MAVIYNNTLKTTRMNAVKTASDAGAAAATLEICTASYAVVILVFTFSDPCGTVAGDPATLTFSGMPKSTTGLTPGGAAVIARIKDSDGTIVASGLTVGAVGSGMNIEIDNTSVLTGQVVNLLGGQLVHG